MKLKQADAKTAPAASQENPQATGFLPLDGLLVITDKETKKPVIKNRKIDEDHVAQLSKSIEESGLDVPLIVWNGGQPGKLVEVRGKKVEYNVVVAGFHRRRALLTLLERNPKRFKELFPNGIPVVVKGGSLADALATTVRENIARKNCEAKELLPLMKDLRDVHNWSQKVIAKSVGVSEATVSQIFKIEEVLGEEATDEVLKKGVSITDAVKAADKVRKGKATKEEAVAEVKAKTQSKQDSGRERAEKRVSVKTIWAITKVLPKMNQGLKIILLERALQYLAGETDTLPREYRVDVSKLAKASDKLKK